jgi:apolipoprotein N-acyltransferase
MFHNDCNQNYPYNPEKAFSLCFSWLQCCLPMNNLQGEFRPSLMVDVAADYRQGRFILRWRTAVVLTALAMLMLTVIQEQDFGIKWLSFGWGWLTWICLVPWVIAVVGAKSGRRGAIISYTAGFVYFLVNLYWLVWVTVPGWIAMCFYLAFYFVLCGFLLRRIYLRRRWPFTLVLPIIWVGQEYLRSIVMTGFPWFLLGHSQHANLRMIQICDLFGVYGITFLMAMINGLICDILLRPLRQSKSQQRKTMLSAGPLFLLTVCCVLGTMLYGQHRLGEGKASISQGPSVTVIQEVIPQFVKQAGKSDEEIFSRHLALSEKAQRTLPGPDLIVWPETMVPGPLNHEFLSLEPEELTEEGRKYLTESLSYDKRLCDLTTKKVALLAGAPSLTVNEQGQLSRFNSAFLYLPGGGRYGQRYDKMHLVPFGEVVPFKRSWPWLYSLLNSLTPYDYEYSLDAGSDPTVFEFKDSSGKTNRFSVAICYEDVMPAVVRRLAGLENGKKRIDFLLNISNDGWFVRGGIKDEPVKSSSEQLQHLIICKFRAVENRVGIARAVNTGISAFIKPDGAVQKNALMDGFPPGEHEREAVAGYLTDKIYIDTRISLYSRIGDTFAIVCTVLMGLLFLLSLHRKKRLAKK